MYVFCCSFFSVVSVRFSLLDQWTPWQKYEEELLEEEELGQEGLIDGCCYCNRLRSQTI